MSKVFVSVGTSLDGFMAGPNRGPRNPLGDGGLALHEWAFEQQSFRQSLKLGGDGQTGPDNRLLGDTFARTGASIMGRRMFDEGEANWPEKAPFRTEVFVLTHEPRPPWERPGGTRFSFITDGIESALRQARRAAANKDVRISGGAHAIAQFLNAGLVDELVISVAPILLGAGLRLFDGVDRARVRFEIVDASSSPLVSHLRYRVRRPAQP